jgi:hypothetical protein
VPGAVPGKDANEHRDKIDEIVLPKAAASEAHLFLDLAGETKESGRTLFSDSFVSPGDAARIFPLLIWIGAGFRLGR